MGVQVWEERRSLKLADYKLGFIGAGAMAEAIINGVLQNGLYSAEEIIASDVNEERLAQIKNKLKINITSANEQVITNCNILILAVKPHQIKGVLESFTRSNNDQIVISIAAGISTQFIENILGQQAVIRVMPNTPALVGAGMSALCKGNYAGVDDLQKAEAIFKAIGETVVIEENLIDGVTGVSGSGPAYVYQFIEALADGGVQVGLPRKTAYALAAQTVIGAGLMVLNTGLHPGELKDMVTSPGGTTIRAINVLEKAGFRAAVMDAVEAAYLTAKKLGSSK